MFKILNLIFEVSDFVNAWSEETEPRSLGKSLSASNEALNKLLYDILYKDEDKNNSDRKETTTTFYFDSTANDLIKLTVKSKLGIMPLKYTFLLKLVESKEYIRNEFIIPLLKTCQYLSYIIETKVDSFNLDSQVLSEIKNNSIKRFNRISSLVFNSLHSNETFDNNIQPEESSKTDENPQIIIENDQIFTNEFLSLNEDQPHFLSLSLDSDEDISFGKTQSDNWRRKDNPKKRKRKELAKKKFV